MCVCVWGGVVMCVCGGVYVCVCCVVLCVCTVCVCGEGVSVYVRVCCVWGVYAQAKQTRALGIALL